MTTEQMTVHEALVESKTLDKRINKEVASFKPVSFKEHSSVKVDGISVEEFNKAAKSSYQKINDLINRHFAIKKAIAKYNAETTITVNGDTLTIAEALWINDYGIAEKQTLLNRLRRVQESTQDRIDEGNGLSLSERAEKFAQQAFSGKDKADPEAVKDVVEDYKKRNSLDLVDPLSIQDRISDLTDDIESYATKVDSAIQVANATHIITIEY